MIRRDMRNKPGRSSQLRFRQQRLKNLRRDWRNWLSLGVMALTAIAFTIFLGGTGLLIGGWMLGLTTAIALMGWMIGGDVYALTWLWGSWGEEQTGDELKALGPDWCVVHDITNAYGNWDHVIVGPAGVFMVDSKRVRGRATCRDDGLSSGRTRYAGKSFRGSAVGLQRALETHAGSCPWVQAVVAIWGDFPQHLHEEGQVVYIAGNHLTNWLLGRPEKLGPERSDSLARAVEFLDTATTS